MELQIKLFLISLLIFVAASEKSKYNNYQNLETIKIVSNDVVISNNCLVTSIPNDFQKSNSGEDIKLYNLSYMNNFDFCNTTNLSLTGYEAVVIVPSRRCGMIQQKDNARSFNIKILLYVTSNHVALPDIADELSKSPAVVLMSIQIFNSQISEHKNVKIGIYGPDKSKNAPRFSELLIFGLVTITVLITMGITVGFVFEILETEDQPESSNNGQFTALPGNGAATSPAKSKQITYAAMIIPVFMIGMLLLMYFFFFIMVWVIILAFYFISAHCFALLIMLFVKKYNWAPSFTKPCNRFGFKSLDYRYIGLFIVGLLISTVWIIFRKNDLGLALNNVIGVYVCISVTLSLGAMFVIGRNFKILLSVLVIVLVIDAVMVYVPIGNNLPEMSQQLPLYSTLNTATRVRRSSGNSIMESVATAMNGNSNEEIPIRFKIPRVPFLVNVPGNGTCKVETNQYSLIGFGDVILPGSFIVYMLIFAVLGKSSVALYFLLTLFGYLIGLVCTYVVVNATKKGQPALVFLLPCTVVPTLLVAVLRREFMSLWHSAWLPERLVSTTSTTDIVPSSAENNM